MTIQLNWEKVVVLVGGIALLSGSILVTPKFDSLARLDGLIVGTGVLLLALLALIRYRRWYLFPVAALGIWLVVAPGILKFTADKPYMWSHEIIGVALLAIAFSSLLSPSNEDTDNAEKTPLKRSQRFGQIKNPPEEN